MPTGREAKQAPSPDRPLPWSKGSRLIPYLNKPTQSLCGLARDFITSVALPTSAEWATSTQRSPSTPTFTYPFGMGVVTSPAGLCHGATQSHFVRGVQLLDLFVIYPVNLVCRDSFSQTFSYSSGSSHACNCHLLKFKVDSADMYHQISNTSWLWALRLAGTGTFHTDDTTRM